MMSKERELLERCAEAFSIHNKCPNLIIEIQNLLDQPEQEPSVKLPESDDEAVLSDNWLRNHAPHRLNQPEPVAWMNESGGCFLSDGNKYSDYWTPLYTSPTKREPLSNEQIRGLDDDVSWFADSHTFSAVMCLIRSVEKAHGIGVDDEH